MDGSLWGESQGWRCCDLVCAKRAGPFETLVTSDPTAQTYTGTFEGPLDNDTAELVLEFGAELANHAPSTVCLDDIELNDPQFEVPLERTAQKVQPRIRVNQVGYLPGFSKIATLVRAEANPVTWRLVDGGARSARRA